MDIKKLLEKMTLEEKLAQISQFNANCLHVDSEGGVTGPASSLKLTKEQVAATGSTLNFVGAKEMIAVQKEHLENDPNKIPLLFMQDVVHGYRTIYPIPLGLGASFDTEIVEECCQMAAKEAAVGGVHVTFAPMVDLVRDARWGRCMESTGEDPYLNGKMARAMVRGFQGDFTDKYNIAACIKHFAAYGAAEAGRDYNTVDMSEHVLRNYYLPSYKAAVDEGVRMVMTSFNLLNGVPAAGNKWLVQDILRGEWGFDNVIISDYDAFREMIVHGYCEDEIECAETAMIAGNDIEMMSVCYLKGLPKLLEENKISMQQIDEAVLRVLKLKNDLGLFENPYRVASEEEEQALHLCAEHRLLARKAAERSAVLLKNDGVLPFNKFNVKRIAVVGPFANEGMIGGWACHGQPEEAVSVYQGIKALLPNAEVLYARGCSGAVNEIDCSKIKEAVEIAKTCDAVVVCAGEFAHFSGEGNSRAGLRLSVAQQTLIRQISEVNKQLAVLLFNGRPLVLSDVIEDAPAWVTMWQPGTEGGSAAARLLFGEADFSARLPMTFPKAEGQCPIYYNANRTGRPKWDDNADIGYVSRYIDVTNAPLFPFGYGLSYTEFSYSAPQLDKKVMQDQDTLNVSVRIKNIGQRRGTTLAQMYICDQAASLVRPVKELKGFQRVELEPNQEKTITFAITKEDLAFWTARGCFDAEKGKFTLWVAENSAQGEGVEFSLV